MSSFKRKTASTSQWIPQGTKPSPALSALLITSTGIPSLDDILGGGIQLGTSLVVLNADPHSAHTDLLQKYFIAQGLASDHAVHIFDPDARSLAESCMWMPGASATHVPDEAESLDGEGGKVKIAWRYERMQKFKTTVSSQSSDQEDYCRPLDISSRIPVGAIDAFVITGQLHFEDTSFENTGEIFDSVVRRINNVVETRYSLSASNKQIVTRLSIPAFADPSWGNPTPQIIVHFLLKLRNILRNNPLICALITLPAEISSEAWAGEGWLEKVSWVSDACISLNSSTVLADPATAALFPSHHGLLRILKLPCVQTLIPASDRFSSLRGLSSASSTISSGGVGENNLAFKCTRKRFIIETFHLDVEGGVGERRTTPATSSIALQEGVSDKEALEKHAHHDQSKILIEVEVKPNEVALSRDEMVEESMVHGEDFQVKQATKKKPKKRVGFQVERPDIFDF